MRPTDVKLQRADGTVLNCELIHQGISDDGIDHWAIAGMQYRSGDQITIGELPALTAVGFELPKDMDPNRIRVIADEEPLVYYYHHWPTRPRNFALIVLGGVLAWAIIVGILVVVL